jgi:hypothetical protein
MQIHNAVKELILTHLDKGKGYNDIDLLVRDIITTMYKKVTADIYMSLISNMQEKFNKLLKGTNENN